MYEYVTIRHKVLRVLMINLKFKKNIKKLKN